MTTDARIWYLDGERLPDNARMQAMGMTDGNPVWVRLAWAEDGRRTSRAGKVTAIYGNRWYVESERPPRGFVI